VLRYPTGYVFQNEHLRLGDTFSHGIRRCQFYPAEALFPGGFHKQGTAGSDIYHSKVAWERDVGKSVGTHSVGLLYNDPAHGQVIGNHGYVRVLGNFRRGFMGYAEDE